MAGTSRLRALVGSPYRIGLGGEGVLRTHGKDREARAVLEAAYGRGIRYYDSAPAYAGSEDYYGQFWAQHPDWKEGGTRPPESLFGGNIFFFGQLI